MYTLGVGCIFGTGGAWGGVDLTLLCKQVAADYWLVWKFPQSRFGKMDLPTKYANPASVSCCLLRWWLFPELLWTSFCAMFVHLSGSPRWVLTGRGPAFFMSQWLPQIICLVSNTYWLPLPSHYHQIRAPHNRIRTRRCSYLSTFVPGLAFRGKHSLQFVREGSIKQAFWLWPQPWSQLLMWFPAAPSDLTTGHMATGEPSKEPSHSQKLICESYSPGIIGTSARFILPCRVRKRKMPHTGLLVRNERLSIELGHLLLNSNVN